MSTLQNPSHTYLTSDDYTVTLIATNGAGSDTVTKTDYITVTYTEPVANFTADLTHGAAPLTVQFTDTSENSPTTWIWKFGDGGKSTDQNPTHVYTEVGTYTVSLTSKNSAGSNSTHKNDYITISSVSAPVASFNADTRSGTVPFNVRFTDTSSNTPTSWLWSFGDGASSTEANPVHEYSAAGTYTVSLMAANAAGNNSQVANNYIIADGVMTRTRVTTEEPAADETAPEVTAAVTTVRTTAPAASSTSSSSTTYIIAGIIAIIVIGAGVLLYSRNRSGGGHHRGGGQL
jgi:PKD repeat protein